MLISRLGGKKVIQVSAKIQVNKPSTSVENIHKKYNFPIADRSLEKKNNSQTEGDFFRQP